MKRKILIFCIYLSILTITTGCWARKELNDLAIAVAMGIDKVDEQYLITVQIVNPAEIASNKGAGRSTPVVVFQEKGDTLFETLRKMTTNAPRKIYLAHLRIVIFGEELAREGIRKTLDFFSRDHEFRPDFNIVVAKDSRAEDVLKVLTSLEAIPANKLYNALETSEKVWAPSMSVTFDTLDSKLSSEGDNPVLTSVYKTSDKQSGGSKQNIENLDPPVRLKYNGLAVFKDDKLIGWLSEGEGKGVNYALGEVKNTVITFSCPQEGKVSLEVLNTKTDLKTKGMKGDPKGLIKLNVEANVAEVECASLDLNKISTIYDLEKKAEKDIKDVIIASIEAAQKKHQTDIFGFGDALHRSAPESWKELKTDWDQRFANMPITVDVKVKIPHTGTIRNYSNQDDTGE
ncbi:Ger(x)C family spore germination protein [Niallia endozanthoxylica]|uniref:Ger(X)C family spore germination protein n=1 Tax=Niallia endozanthoxylica TaxID=2036016 RepID=A0A5J5I5H5_9BACI|nr:Ger(x)C family spore germination protein [Niallia endozanthoxylica]KAA9030670.1 Ger(x)C family spore germination protein [Niallia endozanthoxylica]